MPAQLTTKAQVNGYRFLLRRLEHALVRRDVRMLHDPMRSQMRSLLVGLVLAILVVAGFGVYGLIKPQGSVGDSRIIVSKKAGAMYVVVDGRLHPVLNLTSARLITGGDDSPKSVAEKKLTGYPRGPLLGIPGAPVALPGPADDDVSDWAVCDTGAAAQVTTIATTTAPVLGEQIRAAADDEAALVTAGDEVYLVADGKRARVDTESVPVRRALNIDDADVRPISPGVLNAIPEVEPVVVPTISNRGAPSALGRDVPIGAVVKVTGLSDDETFYVALAQGLQKIGEVAAEIIRQADSAGADSVPTLSPDELTGVETVSVLPVDGFPAKAPRLVDVDADPVLCSAWSRSVTDHEATGRVLLGSKLPVGSRDVPVVFAGADGVGPGLDGVFVAPGRGHYIQVTGSEPDSTRAESLFYVNDSGVRYGIADKATAKVLGLGDTPVPAPWSIVSLLAAGPTLSQHNALMSHDGMAPDPAGTRIDSPAE